MILWLDAQLSPHLAKWIASTFSVECKPVRDLNLRDADDPTIFEAARSAPAVVITKDRDFVDMLIRKGPPPQILWITCGNTSNARIQEIFMKSFPLARGLLEKGESLVEITDAS